MKIFKNTSMQGLSIPFGTPEGVKTVFVGPKKQIEVPNNWKSKVVENLVHRRMGKLTIVPDPQPEVVPNPVKKRKTKTPVESD
jgi:hypothetical protein